MKHKILHGIVDGQHFVISIFDDKDIIAPLKAGLEKSFARYELSKIKEKRKKESDHGYLILSGNSSGCRRK